MPKKDSTSTKDADPAVLQFSVEGDPYWCADLYDSGRSVVLYGKSKEQVEQRAAEILASRQAAAEAAQAGEAWAEVTEDRTQTHVTQ